TVVSTRRIAACPWALRNSSMCSACGGARSAVYFTSPRSIAGSSRALRASPTPLPATPLSAIALPALPAGDRQRGPDDAVVPGAAAQVAGQCGTHLRLVRCRVAGQQLAQGDHHAGNAEPALCPVLLPQRGLQRVQTGLRIA